MKLVENERYICRDMALGSEVRLEIIELMEYKGQYLAVARAGGDPRHNPLVGVQQTPTRVAAFAVLPKAPLHTVAWFVDLFKGKPLVLFDWAYRVKTKHGKPQAAAGIPILNCGEVKGVWAPARTGTSQFVLNKRAMIEACTKMVDIYIEWRETGKLPAWFVTNQALERMSLN